MQCQQIILAPVRGVRTRQCRNHALKGKQYCFFHDDSTLEIREEIKKRRSIKQTKLYEMHMLLKQKYNKS